MASGNHLRQSGIRAAGALPWGSHFCQFYETAQDLADTLVPYFRTGLEANEFCMWVTSEPLRADAAKKALRASMPNLDEFVAAGQIEILDYAEWYTKSGGFNAGEVLRGWIDKLDAALKRGYEGLRLSGNTFWLEQKDWQDFARYEETVNSVIGGKKMIALCTYSLEKCGALEIAEVIANHEFALLKRSGQWQTIESAHHKQVETALGESEARYRSLYAAMTEGMAIHEIVYGQDGRAEDYRILDVNPSYEKITGITRDKAINALASDLYGTGAPPYIDIYARVAQTRQPESFETTFAPIAKSFRISVFSPAQGRFATVFEDITERTRAEETLRRSMNLLDEMGRIAKIGAWELDTATMKQEWTDETYAIHDRERGSYDPNSSEEISRFVPGSKELIEKAFGEAIAEGKPYDLEAEMTTVKENRKWVRAACVPQIENGKVVKLKGTVQDITDRKKNEEALLRHTLELEEFNALMIGRELRMIELKKEINELCRRHGEPPRYETGDEAVADIGKGAS